MSAKDTQADIASIQSISSVPTILEAIAALTGLRFVCIARVTNNSWTTCAVLDKLGFGLKVGDDLDIATTLCAEVRDIGKAVVIDNVSEDASYATTKLRVSTASKAIFNPPYYALAAAISPPCARSTTKVSGWGCSLCPKCALAPGRPGGRVVGRGDPVHLQAPGR